MIDGARLNFGFWVDSAFFVDIVHQKHRWIGAHNAIVSNRSTVRATRHVTSLFPVADSASGVQSSRERSNQRFVYCTCIQ